jgi:eukaryotic-like serine/threonine-protein kinase
LLEPFQVFAGRYRVISRLAEGGMGVVFVAHHTTTEERVALKVLFPHVLRVDSARKKFELEAKIWARVRSDHIVRVLDADIVGETDCPYLVMELLQGQTLAARIQQGGPLSWPEAVELMTQLARGLDAAHRYVNAAGVREPIVHRDLKPENLFLAERGDGPALLKILDFGIAKALSESTALSQDVRGTPAFMAYEQLTGQEPSPRTDVWALGLITYYALTGHHYWRSVNGREGEVQALFAEILHLPLQPPSARIREDGIDVRLPEGFDAWLLSCVARDASQRFESAGRAVDALRGLHGSRHEGAVSSTLSRPPAPNARSNDAADRVTGFAPSLAASVRPVSRYGPLEQRTPTAALAGGTLLLVFALLWSGYRLSDSAPAPESATPDALSVPPPPEAPAAAGDPGFAIGGSSSLVSTPSTPVPESGAPPEKGPSDATAAAGAGPQPKNPEKTLTQPPATTSNPLAGQPGSVPPVTSPKPEPAAATAAPDSNTAPAATAPSTSPDGAPAPNESVVSASESSGRVGSGRTDRLVDGPRRAFDDTIKRTFDGDEAQPSGAP